MSPAGGVSISDLERELASLSAQVADERKLVAEKEAALQVERRMRRNAEQELARLKKKYGEQ